MRRTLPIGVLAAFPACWISSRGDVGIDRGPTVYEAYEVRGTVVAAGLTDRPIEGACVAAVQEGRVLSATTTDREGGFRLEVGRGGDQPAGTKLQAGVDGSVYPIAHSGPQPVQHNYAAVQGHEHREVRVTARAVGFVPQGLAVEVPRDTRAEPVKLLLRPRPVEADEGGGQTAAPEEPCDVLHAPDGA